jgi:tRNA dimethylallyltransferase
MAPAPQQAAASPPVLVIAGPTGSGKSALAIDVARAFAGTVINADSAQVYRELRILSARPSAADEALVPHRLYGVLPAAEAGSVGRWLRLAWAEIEQAWGENRLPVVVGGTGLYLKALIDGLSDVPEVPDPVRDAAAALFERLGEADFRVHLRGCDAAAESRIRRGDRQRLIRALAVQSATGTPLAEWQRQRPPAPTHAARYATVALLPPRPALYARLDARLQAMIAEGGLTEVKALLAAGLDPNLPALKAVGVRQLASYVRGETTYEAALAAAQQETRRLAKRQMTWLRHQLGIDKAVCEQYSASVRDGIFAFIRQFLLTPGA